MLSYDESSRIFPCILLTRNHMIFLVQFGINKHLLISQRSQTCQSIYSCLFIANCTGNHVITYTNCTVLSPITWVKMFPGHISFFMGRSTFFINDVQERLNHVKFGKSVVFFLWSTRLVDMKTSFHKKRNWFDLIIYLNEKQSQSDPRSCGILYQLTFSQIE